MPTRPDHALQDLTRLRFLTPRPEPTEGLATVTADLTVFFVIVGDVGRNEALLLLLVRALRQRTGLLALRVNDLAWMLRVSNRRVIRWLDRLVHHRLVVYHVEDFWGVDTVIVEIVGASVSTRDFERAVQQDLPTHWFVQVLPILGRTTFTVFLYFLWCEPHRPETHIDHLVETTALRGRVHARWHLRRLRAQALLTPDASGLGMVVRDPAPPTRLQRLHLRFLAVPFLRRALVHVGLMTLALLAIIAVLLLLHALPSFPRV
ncbi:MAG: hypothetical protein QOI24_1231 [Acidobacteriota bacterium]|nr:hypothetical protein [Acidobacteriota bacterium]